MSSRELRPRRPHMVQNEYNERTNENNLNPGLVTSYDIQPGNTAGLFSKEKRISQ